MSNRSEGITPPQEAPKDLKQDLQQAEGALRQFINKWEPKIAGLPKDQQEPRRTKLRESHDVLQSLEGINQAGVESNQMMEAGVLAQASGLIEFWNDQERGEKV
jgi:hypothetical protein